jgi:hypothetical protein
MKVRARDPALRMLPFRFERCLLLGRLERPRALEQAVRLVRQRRDRTFEHERLAVGVAFISLAIDRTAIAHRVAVAQDEARQPLVEAAMFADEFALVVMRDGDAVDRAADRGVGQARNRIVERVIPGDAKRLRAGVAAQAIGPLDRHADGTRGLCHAGAFGERLDKGDLAFGRPAIVARTHGHGSEGTRGGFGRGAWRAGGLACHVRD